MHQIRREKRTTISEVIVRGKRNIKQNRNWFYFKFSVESSSFKLGKIYAYLWRLKQTSLSFVWFYQSVFLSKIVEFHPRTVERIVTALMLSLLFRCFSLFLPHLRTLAQGKRSENCLRFGTGGPSLCLYPLLSRNILFFPTLTMAAISVHNRDFEHVYVYWIWLCGSASYDIIYNKLSKHPLLPLIRWCTMFMQWSVYYFYRKITYQRQSFRFWRMHSTQNTFKGLENEATFSWNGLLPTLIVKEKPR